MTDEPIETTSREVDRTPAVRHAVSVSPTTPTAEWGVIVAQAEVLARSNIIPRAFTGKPENIIAAAITGRQFGWDVMAAMRNVHVIEGTVTIRPEAQVGLVRAAGHSITGSSSSERAEVTGTRADTGDTMTVVWTIEDAKAANLTGKAVWKQYPADMLWARAVSALCRRLFADVTLGLSYTPDELDRSGEQTPAPDFSGDVADPAAPVVAPPDGWESWDECEQAHEALRDAVKAATPQARNQWQGYLRDSGYESWFTKPQLDELAAQLEILVGAPTERAATMIPEAEVVDETAGDGHGDRGEPGTATRSAHETPAPALPDPDPQPASVPVGDELDGHSALALDLEPAVEAPTPEAPPSDVPAPGGGAPQSDEPMNKALLNRLGSLTRELGLDRDVKLKIATWIVGRPVQSTKDISRADGTWLAGALRHLRDGHLSLEVDDDGDLFLAIADPTDGAGNPEVLPGAVWMRDFAKYRGLEFEIRPID